MKPTGRLQHPAVSGDNGPDAVLYVQHVLRRVEDLQFSVEEACITRGDLEVTLGLMIRRHIRHDSRHPSPSLMKLGVDYVE